MRKIVSRLLVCLSAVFVFCLAGCGGGGNSGAAAPVADRTVSGVAATGAPIAGTVYLKDSSGQEISKPIGADGSFSFDVTNLTAPFMLKAAGTADGQNYTLYSLASEAGVVNVNPLSHVAVVQANAGSDPTSLYADLTASQLQALNTRLATIVPAMKSTLQPILSEYGVSATDFINDPYAANHLGLDLLFDTIGITSSGGNLTMTNKATGAAILTASLTADTLSGQINVAGIPEIASQPAGSVFVYPENLTIPAGGTIQFKSIVKSAGSQAVTWRVIEAGGGTITRTGLYTAPSVSGTYHVTASNFVYPTKKGTATITVTGGTQSDVVEIGTLPDGTIQNYVKLQSDSGDYIGDGRNYRYTNANAVLTVSAEKGVLSVRVEGDQNWSGSFQVPATLTQLQAGSYSDLKRYPFYTPGLSWSGEGRGSNTLTGSFTIHNVKYVEGALAEVDLTFEQHSEGAVPALRGEIHWTSRDNTTPPGPVDAPAALWAAAPGSLPGSGNYVYLHSQSGDYIGAGKSYTYTGAEIAVKETDGHLEIRIENDRDYWSGHFQVMNILSQLQPGYYGGLIRYPFHNPTKGGLSWSGNGRGCNRLTGWFSADNATYVNGALSSVDLSFEQHCEGGTPALHGTIHWSK